MMIPSAARSGAFKMASTYSACIASDKRSRRRIFRSLFWSSSILGPHDRLKAHVLADKYHLGQVVAHAVAGLAQDELGRLVAVVAVIAVPVERDDRIRVLFNLATVT